MKDAQYTTNSEAELQGLGKTIARIYCPKNRVFAFIGPLGAGKTTCIKGLAKAEGVSQAITSPTFTLVHEYSGKKKTRPFVHVDLYRIKKIEELYPIGFYEHLLAKETTMCIEWADRFPKVLKNIPHIEIRITITGVNSRKIMLTKH